MAIIAHDIAVYIIVVYNQGRERDIFAACDKERVQTNDDKKMFLIILFLSIISYFAISYFVPPAQLAAESV